ncbi:acyclic terpene utilization AtuA family protein [Nocardioides zeae]|uniref:Acyclic terpene utilization AtuA family protein n=1 Tax=Nocardioides imazamoxiresistens TaxID=3231893 RepID=A0ABU3PUF6_9ACTN|nr:acyclic terpene utilization AtuA family protein [Nocardioides zeae]MDT9592870.1 acyclic terpene utilization AtuA family protein [Nocardioides zeae]
MSEVLRVGNCSGFYGDRLSAMREMLEGVSTGPDGPHGVDVLTGDYLAELTMLILGKDQMKDASAGYARTFLHQAEDCLGLALEKGVRIVSNAGGLNPAGLARKLVEVAHGLGLAPRVAYVSGDDLRPGLQAGTVALEPDGDWSAALTANAYLGAFGIARALGEGADVVVTGRVTDASVVVGPAIARFGWTPDDHDRLAGATVAGHVIECGAQATGGNFSGFGDLPPEALSTPLGFPVAEIEADGSFTVTKHDGTGGAVTTDTVTAQLVYEIQTHRYLGPDVTTHLDSIRLTPDGPDRVRVDGVVGSAPPPRLKVAVNVLGGWRNSVEMVLTGLDIDDKAAWVRAQVEAALDASPTGRPATLDWSDTGPATADAPTEESASVLLRATALDPDAEKVGRAFTGAAVELALASYPGFALTAPPARPSPYGVYRPAYVDRAAVEHAVVVLGADGEETERVLVPHPEATAEIGDPTQAQRPSPYPAPVDTLTRRMPLGTFVHARSGDKGGDANIGLWVATTGQRHDPERHDARVVWLTKLVDPGRVRELVPEAADLEVEVHPLPNLGGVNVVVKGLLGAGVAASTRFDPQAKGLGEWVRSRMVSVEDGLL